MPGLVLATGLPADTVEAALRVCLDAPGRPWQVWRADRNGRALYTLASRKPGPFWRLPGLRSVGDWLSAPVIGDDRAPVNAPVDD